MGRVSVWAPVISRWRSYLVSEPANSIFQVRNPDTRESLGLEIHGQHSQRGPASLRGEGLQEAWWEHPPPTHAYSSLPSVSVWM